MLNNSCCYCAACDKAGDNDCVTSVFEQLVVHYPKTEYWQNLMVSLRKGDTDDIQKLNVMRLSQQVKVMKGAEEYKEFAQLSLDEKLACEAQTVLEQGFTNKAFVEKRDVDVNTRLLTTAKTRAAAEKAALAAADAAAKAAPAGDADVTVGAQYLMCGDAAKGVEVLQRGIAKGSIAKGTPKEAERVDEAQLLLGLAHLRNNNKAEAAKAFRAREARSDDGAHREVLDAREQLIRFPGYRRRAGRESFRPFLFGKGVGDVVRSRRSRDVRQSPRRRDRAHSPNTSSLCCPRSGAGVRTSPA